MTCLGDSAIRINAIPSSQRARPVSPAGESRTPHLRVDFDRRLKLEFHGSKVTSDAGLLAYRELDDALDLTEVAGGLLQDSRTGKNRRHGMVGQFRQSVFGRLGGYLAVLEDMTT